MKRFPRFSPAVVVPILLVVSAAVVRCIPNPDLSGLPPYDGGLSSEDTGAPVSTDANIDVSTRAPRPRRWTAPRPSGP
jgi:hypothetical protein